MEDNSTEISEVDRRIQLASCYHPLLKEDFIENDSEFTEQVLAEVRDFVKTRLAELMGVKESTTKTAVAQFNKEEVAVLKAVAKKLIKKPELSEVKVDERLVEPQVKAKVAQPGTPSKIKKVGKKQVKNTEVNNSPIASETPQQEPDKPAKKPPMVRPANAPKPQKPPSSWYESLARASETFSLNIGSMESGYNTHSSGTKNSGDE